MNESRTGSAIRALRQKQGLSQQALAQRLCISDKTVSKWETGRGLPDIGLLEPLAAALGASPAELLAGAPAVNENRHADLRRSRWYCCPVCGNILWAVGAGAFSCCGRTLEPLAAAAPDEAHAIRAERVEDDWYVTLAHPMEKAHHLQCIAYVTAARVQLVRLYPEQEAAVRFPLCGSGRILAICSRHGLSAVSVG